MSNYALFPSGRYPGVVKIGDGYNPNLDAFSRIRTSHADTIFDSTFLYNTQPLIYETKATSGGSATHSAADASVSLAVDGTSGAEVAIQSKRYMPYVPGKSQLVVMTGVFKAAVAGVTKRMGYFDADNGVYFEQNGTTDYGWVVRTNTSGSPSNANRVAQSSWNIDTLDGSGPSGITADFTKAQIIVIDLQWLGMGRVRVGFDINGQIYYVHAFNWANTSSATTVYMRTANLPIRWELDGNTEASMLATCASVQSEGGKERYASYGFTYDRGSVTAGSGSQTYAFSLRPKSTYNSITNRMGLDITEFELAVSGNSAVLIEIYYNTTVGGTPSWTDVDTTYSAMQYDTAGTPSGGFKVMSFVVASAATSKGAGYRDFNLRYPLVMDIAGTGYINMTVYVTGLGGASACYPCVHWNEVR